MKTRNSCWGLGLVRLVFKQTMGKWIQTLGALSFHLKGMLRSKQAAMILGFEPLTVIL